MPNLASQYTLIGYIGHWFLALLSSAHKLATSCLMVFNLSNYPYRH